MTNSGWITTTVLALSGAAAACGSSGSGTSVDAAEPPAPEVWEIAADRVTADLSTPSPDAAYWKTVPRGAIALTAQPMIAPRPETTTTQAVVVQAIHDGTTIAFRLQWKDREPSHAGRLGEFSDALALQFPTQAGAATPVMMGAPDLPVHIFHWRAQYQHDKEHGKPSMTDLYPHMSIDMYPMDFKEAEGGSAADKEAFSPGLVAGNPQSYEKTGVDEIIAEGFSTSQVQAGHGGAAAGEWAGDGWTLVITRPLAIEGGSNLTIGGDNQIAFAVWQGGLREVGSRKSVTMTWIPLKVH
jgi:hypothetical protein